MQKNYWKIMNKALLAVVCCLAMLMPAVCQVQDTVRVQKRRVMPKTSLLIDYERGSVGDFDRMRAVLTVPFFHARYLTLSANGRYNLIDQNFDGKVSGLDAEEINLNGTHQMFTAGVSAYSRIKIGGGSINMFGHVMMDFGRWGYENTTGLLAGMVMLKETREESLGFGVVGLIHSSSKWPVFPTVSWRKLLSPRLFLEMTLPKVGVHYYVHPTMKCSAGTDIDVDRFYFRPKTEGMGKTCRYNRNVLKLGGSWEWKPASAVLIRASAGTAIKLKSEVTTVDGRNEYFDVDQPLGIYFNVGTSLSL